MKCRPAWWHRLVCRLADNNPWPLRGLRLWLVWPCVSEKASVTGVLVLLSETMTNAVILRTECAGADIDWRGPHKCGNSYGNVPLKIKVCVLPQSSSRVSVGTVFSAAGLWSARSYWAANPVPEGLTRGEIWLTGIRDIWHK